MKRALAMISALLLVSAATAATYYVSPAGNDNNAGTEESPVRTISKGISKATQAGDIVSVADGDYEIGSQITVSKAISIQGNVSDCAKVVVNCKGIQDTLKNDSGVDGWSISGLTFTNINRAVYSKKSITISCCVFRQTKSGGANTGAALCFPAGSADGVKVVEDCVFEDLKTASNCKGAIYLDGTFPIVVRRCVFRNCNATNNGGAIGQQNAGDIVLTVENCEFMNCSSSGSGAIYLLANTGKTATLRDCLFVGNASTATGNSPNGSAVMTSTDIIFENCTFADNTSATYNVNTAVVRVSAGTSSFVNCVFWNNLRLNKSGGTLSKEVSVSGTYVASSSAAPTAAALTGDTNITLSASPFAAAGVYTLAGEDNPCLGTGVKLDWMTADSLDLAGNPRLRGNNIVDLGCYEFVETGSFKGFLMLID